MFFIIIGNGIIKVMSLYIEIIEHKKYMLSYYERIIFNIKLFIHTPYTYWFFSSDYHTEIRY